MSIKSTPNQKDSTCYLCRLLLLICRLRFETLVFNLLHHIKRKKKTETSSVSDFSCAFCVHCVITNINKSRVNYMF